MLFTRRLKSSLSGVNGVVPFMPASTAGKSLSASPNELAMLPSVPYSRMSGWVAALLSLCAVAPQPDAASKSPMAVIAPTLAVGRPGANKVLSSSQSRPERHRDRGGDAAAVGRHDRVVRDRHHRRGRRAGLHRPADLRVAALLKSALTARHTVAAWMTRETRPIRTPRWSWSRRSR